MGKILGEFQQGNAHMAIVCEDAQSMAEEANMILEAIKNEGDEGVSTTAQQVLGITTLEKVIEAIMRIPILDEKDIEKMRSEVQYSVSQHHEQEDMG